MQLIARPCLVNNQALVMRYWWSSHQTDVSQTSKYTLLSRKYLLPSGRIHWTSQNRLRKISLTIHFFKTICMRQRRFNSQH